MPCCAFVMRAKTREGKGEGEEGAGMGKDVDNELHSSSTRMCFVSVSTELLVVDKMDRYQVCFFFALSAIACAPSLQGISFLDRLRWWWCNVEHENFLVFDGRFRQFDDHFRHLVGDFDELKNGFDTSGSFRCNLFSLALIDVLSHNGT